MAKTKKSSRKPLKKKDQEILIYLYALLCITLSVIGLLEIGIVGIFLTSIIRYFFGNFYAMVYAFAIVAGVMLLFNKNFEKVNRRSVFGLACFFLAWILFAASPADTTMKGISVFTEFIKHSKEVFSNEIPLTVGSGGLIGAFLYAISSALFDRIGTLIFEIALVVMGTLMFINNKYLRRFFNAISRFFTLIMQKLFKAKKKRTRKVKKEKINVMDDFDMDVMNYNENQSKFEFLDIDEEPVQSKEDNLAMPLQNEFKEEQAAIDSAIQELKIPEIKQDDSFVSVFDEDYTNYQLPKLNLLKDVGKNGRSNSNYKAAKEGGDRLMRILDEFGVKATLVETHVGPSVTKFEVKPDLGVRVSKISNLQDDIKLALAAKDIRIEAPIPSKSAVGIEIPNVEKTMVGMKELMKSVPAKYADSKLLFALGKDLLGNGVYGELNKMPHLLIAGATGSGKSVCVNSIIVSILMRAKPDEVKLLLIDPKKVEFTMYAQIPHLLGPLITDGEEASAALKVIVNTMDNRYELFAAAGVRNIAGYNQYIEEHPEEGLKKMPWIVVIIDELADLMLVAAKDVESSIQRITQLARAAGIHLIVATQRPSVDVITGIIKANIPSRIAFAVSSAVDSRTILDQQGAEKLLGMGDMLYIPVGETAVTRVQGVYVSDDEVHNICEFVSAQGRPKFDDAFIRLQMVDRGSGALESNDDPLYEEVKEFVIQSQKASTSFIQRKFSIGYSRAARLIDTLEDHGIVGPARGSKPREVFIKALPTQENLDI